MTALVGATALAGGGFLQMVPKIAAAKAAMKDLKLIGRSLATGFAGGTAITLGLAAIASGIANVGSEAVDFFCSLVAGVAGREARGGPVRSGSARSRIE